MENLKYEYLEPVHKHKLGTLLKNIVKNGTDFWGAMGGWLSYYWWGGDPDEVSPISGLSRREVYAVQKSWQPVSADLTGTGNEILRRYFNSYPETKEFFRMIRGKTEAEYSQNPQFKAHVINLMTALNLGVTTLHEPELVAAMMNKLGESHGRRKIKEENFQGLKTVVIKLLSDVLKPDSATLSAWGKTIDFWYKHVFETLSTPEGTR